MRIGVGLPNAVRGLGGEALVEWARRAERRGFSSLVTTGRVSYPNYDSLVALAAAAAVTRRIELLTSILIAPSHAAVHLAKQAASIDQVSGGRLTLGFGVGARPEDFSLVGMDFATRGRRFDEDLALMHRAWAGEDLALEQPVCPPPVRAGRIPIVFGGLPDFAIPRILRWGTGYTISGLPAELLAPVVAPVREAWTSGGKPGSLRVIGTDYYSLGDDATERSRAWLRDYYAYMPDHLDTLVEGAARSPTEVRERVQSFERAGFDDLVFDPSVPDIKQVDRLADALAL